MNRILYDVHLDASLENIAILRARIAEILEKLGFDSTRKNAVKLALSEATSNFVVHSQAIQSISIRLCHSDDQLTLTLKEHGTQCNQSAVQQWVDSVKTEKQSPSSLLDSFDINRSGGRGAALTATLIDSICSLPLIETVEQDVTVFSSGFILSWQTIKPKKHILIVDDDRALATLYQSYLRTQYEVSLCNSVEAALILLDKTRFDLILSDIHMPVLNGIEFREQVSKHEFAVNTPFIFMSGDKKADEHQGLSRLGIDDFLTKPIVKGDLLNRVIRALTRINQLNQLNDILRTQSITQSLIPALPTKVGAWRFSAISEGIQPGGGDLVIVKEQGDSCLLVIADIMGHDIAAKFFSHAYLGYMRGVLCASSAEPEEFLSLLSKALFEDELLSKSMCTCCAIKLCPDGLIRVASAGHPPPIILSNQRELEIKIEGMLPGLMPDIVYASKEYQLLSGERLAVFTDGFIDPSELHNTQAVDRKKSDKMNLLDTHQDLFAGLMYSMALPIERAASSIFKTMKDTKGGVLEDDTLLVLVEPKQNMDQ